MKPGSRAEFNFEQDVPDVTIGHAEVGREDDDRPAAVLWIPDPEQRYGWREFYVRRPVTQRRRRVGFGR